MRCVFASSLAGLAVLGVVTGYGFENPEDNKAMFERNQRAREEYFAKNPFNANAFAANAVSLPKNFNWCKQEDGRALCTPSWNQHIPTYCGSCWAHATLSMLQDRMFIMQQGKETPVMLSRQTILDCAPFLNMSHGCHGGSPQDVMQYMQKRPIPDESCNPYRAEDYTRFGTNATTCPYEGYCSNCMMKTKDGKRVNECWPVVKPIRYTVKDFGPLPNRNVDAMMVEIFVHGPIACGVDSYDDFIYNYRGGVWKKQPNVTMIDHVVEVVGWGDSAEEGPYWVVRNSWGTYWGEKGFFKVPRGNNALLLEEDCWFGVPDWSVEKAVDEGKLQGSMYGLVPNPDAKDEDDIFPEL